MIFISHRGESIDAPENTLPAFELSRQRNTSGMECDIHLTQDNVLVTIHDNHTGRVGNKKMDVENSTYAQLQTVDVSNGKAGFKNIKIPKFSQTLQHLGNDRIFYIEIKGNDPAVIDAMIQELDNAQIAPEQVVMIAFAEEIVRIFKERYPSRKALLLVLCSINPHGHWTPSADELIAKLRELNADGVDIGANLHCINQEYVNKVKAAGFDFAVWTIDNENIAKTFIDYGVDAITSNCAGYLQEIFDK
ncbi:MAG: hypothetical protein E7053_03020 [Lentisphaerae bacterium]|nr:hypothetical protein [Lentisphaerota bacterium]